MREWGQPDRTDAPPHAKRLLYPLSYDPVR